MKIDKKSKVKGKDRKRKKICVKLPTLGNKDRDILKKLFIVFLVTRIILVIFMIISENILSNTDISEYHHVFALFDNEHYLDIARSGYQFKRQYAFFPLTPLLIRYLGKVGFLIFNQVCVLLSGYLLYLIADKFYKKEDSDYPAILYLISPISVFTCMFYSEALFLFLTILAFYLYKSKKSYFALGITLGLSVLTRSMGSMLFFVIFIYMFIDFIKKREKFKNILITYIPATIISCLYPIFLYIRTGDLLYFVTVQYELWGRISTNIFTILFDVIKLTISNPIFIHITDNFIVFGLIVYTLGYIIKHRKEKKYYELFLYMIFSLIAICSTIRYKADALASFYRYIFGCFPIYFMIKKNYFTFGFMIFLSVFTTYFFLLGLWFF